MLGQNVKGHVLPENDARPVRKGIVPEALLDLHGGQHRGAQLASEDIVDQVWLAIAKPLKLFFTRLGAHLEYPDQVDGLTEYAGQVSLDLVPVIRHQNETISWNIIYLLKISSRVIFFSLFRLKSSALKDAMALPKITAFRMFLGEMSSVRASQPMKPPANESPAPVGSTSFSSG